jgi:hypothetical protein
MNYSASSLSGGLKNPAIHLPQEETTKILLSLPVFGL